jgi:hypothetical protein
MGLSAFVAVKVGLLFCVALAIGLSLSFLDGVMVGNNSLSEAERDPNRLV